MSAQHNTAAGSSLFFRLYFVLGVSFVALGCSGSSAPASDPDSNTADSAQDVATPAPDLSVVDQKRVDAEPEDQAVPPPEVVVLDQSTPDQRARVDVPTVPDAGEDTGAQSNPLPDLTTLVLNGSIPQAEIGLPTFNALNSDGSARGAADLMGKPTVMWFFPIAGTPG